MNPGEVGVLLVDDSPVPSASVARALSWLRCEWRYAASCEEALAAMEERKFRVVLSKFKLADGSGRKLIPAVQMASAWLFLSFPVEDGCWWISVVEAGRLSVKAAALHSREFRSALVKIVKATAAGAPQESSTASWGYSTRSLPKSAARTLRSQSSPSPGNEADQLHRSKKLSAGYEDG